MNTAFLLENVFLRERWIPFSLVQPHTHTHRELCTNKHHYLQFFLLNISGFKTVIPWKSCTLSIGDWLQSVPSSILIFTFFFNFFLNWSWGLIILYLELIMELIVELIFWYGLCCVFWLIFGVHICSHLATQVAKNKCISSTKSCIYI